MLSANAVPKCKGLMHTAKQPEITLHGATFSSVFSQLLSTVVSCVVPTGRRYRKNPPSQATSRSRSRTRSLRTTRSPLPRRRSSATQSVASSQPQSKPADRQTSPSPAITQDNAHTPRQNITTATTAKHTPESTHRTSSITLKPNPQFTPKHSTKQTPTPPPPAPLPTVPVQRRPHNLPPPKFQPPTDPAQLDVFQWLNHYAQALDVKNEPMISYVAKVLSAAHLNSTHFTDLQLLTHTHKMERRHQQRRTLLIPITHNPHISEQGRRPDPSSYTERGAEHTTYKAHFCGTR